MRFLLALARAQALTTALGLGACLAVADLFLGAELVPVPFLSDAVEAGRVFPALFAGCGALVVAADWSEHEHLGCRPTEGLILGRWIAGAAVSVGSAALASALLAVVVLLYLVLGALATALPKHWWLALPVLLYLQLYLPPDLLPQ